MRRSLIILGVAACLTACVSTPGLPPAPDGAVVLTGRYFDGVDTIVDQGVVVLSQGHIHCAGRVGDCSTANAHTLLDAGDGFILPGLIDLHVHARPHYLLNFPAAGVTTIRDANNTLDGIADLRSIPGGPRILATGPLLDGPDSVIRAMSETASPPGETPWETIMPVLVSDAAEAREAVRGLSARGVDAIKLYEQLPPDAFAAAVRESHALGLPVMADLGIAATRGLTRATVDALEATQWGRVSLEHLSGAALAYRRLGGDPQGESLDSNLLDRLAAQLAANGAVVVPTLANSLHFSAAVPPALDDIPGASAAQEVLGDHWRMLAAIEPMRERARIDERLSRELLPRLARLGVTIGVGTDTPAAPYTVPGGGVHQELEYLVRVGLTPVQALRAATGDAAAILERDDLGVIRTGAVADLIVVGGDPTTDITRTRDLIWVVLRGEIRPFVKDGAASP